MRYSAIILILCLRSIVIGQINVLHYDLSIHVSDNNDSIIGLAELKLASMDSQTIKLDLSSLDEQGRGMSVSSVHIDGASVQHLHENNKLTFNIIDNSKSTFLVRIKYGGIPQDGLIIGKNKFGNRTFFGDNWPNRAHNWFPCNDHPSDKATFRYQLYFPDHFTCVANGQQEFAISSEGVTNAVYSSKFPLPTKVMVFGLADMVGTELKTINNLDHQAYVYREDRKNGFNDMAVAIDPLEFYCKSVAPYPFDKLHHVQSTTRFGGMENAGCIFYDENAVTGENTMENLIAHEIAHQWFGNSATESDWQHLWLSEGFATYFTALNLENKYGVEKMNEQLRKDRSRVVSFSHNYHTPVIDTISEDLMYLLNPNSYQKGSWILHMLRNKVGDELFWKSIRTYYNEYQYSNASTDDLKEVFEKECNMELEWFFDQWSKRAGQPVIKANLQDGILTFEQIQEGPVYNIEIEVKFDSNETKNTNNIVKSFKLDDRKQKFDVRKFRLKSIVELDPNTKLLFEDDSADE